MIFSSPTFLFIFLPVVLASYLTLTFLKANIQTKNGLLIITSLLFYAWGEATYVLFMMSSIAVNHFFGKMLAVEKPKEKRVRALTIGITLNLSALAYFKYSEFITTQLSSLSSWIFETPLPIHQTHLPLGISFFTFQALSYLIDCYRKVSAPQKSVFGTALYIALFPQLIAGPIVRYQEIAAQLTERKLTPSLFEYGITRFIIGLGKKVLIANPIAQFVDYAFALPQESLPIEVAWLALLGYSLQIYYDFSGYSDMAIGLGAMFGFRFPENFNAPYAARSLREFWRRWHITLSTWFRDYLYFPLEGSRGTFLKTARNLFVIFFLCGLWHGAAWTFVIWGLYHGLFLSLERGAFGRFLERLPKGAQHLYLVFVVAIGWVFFRAESLTHALQFFGALLGKTNASSELFLFLRLNNQVIFLLVIGSLLSLTPLVSKFEDEKSSASLSFALRPALTLLILTLATAKLANGSYDPFIYFRF